MNLESIQKIYAHMADNISRELFLARLNTSITGDVAHIINLPDEDKVLLEEHVRFRDELCKNVSLRTVVFGAGFNGQHFIKELLCGNAFAFIDNYSTEKADKLNGLPIYKLDEYVAEFGIENTRFVICVGNRKASEQIYQQLLNENISPEYILVAPEDYRNNAAQYFDVFSSKEGESFVDCGAYDGSTALGFAAWCGKKAYDKIWCLEPDTITMNKLKDTLSTLRDCSILPYGASDVAKEVAFLSTSGEDSRIDRAAMASDGNIIKTIALDELLHGEKVTFIKMDIEGEEYNALMGAKEIIATQKPRLAISIYHRFDDVVKIPELLLELVPEYKFCIRHYSLLINETVLYAFIERKDVL